MFGEYHDSLVISSKITSKADNGNSLNNDILTGSFKINF
jgi:hypothetical protein